MDPTRQESNAEYRERIRRARLMTPGEKFYEGIRLFEQECEAIRQELCAAHPLADGPKVEAMLRERLAARREKEDEDIYLAYYEVEAREPDPLHLREHPTSP